MTLLFNRSILSIVIIMVKRLFGYDLLKALAMFMVVFYHMNMLDFAYRSDSYYIPNINKIIQVFCAAGVPLFFMVNGALTINKSITMKKVMIKIARLIFVAVIWTFLLRILLIGKLMGHGFFLSPLEFIDFYWFFYSLAIVYFFNYIIQLLPKWFGYVFVLVIFSLSFLNNFMWDVILCVKPDLQLPTWGHTGMFTLYGLVYTRIGAYLKDIKLHFLNCIILVIIGFLLILFETVVLTNHEGQLYDSVNSAFPTLGALLMSCGVFCGIKDFVGRDSNCSKMISMVGTYSGGVYIFHMTLIFLLRENLFQQYLNIYYLPVFGVFLCALAITIVCALFSSLLSQGPCKVLIKL